MSVILLKRPLLFGSVFITFEKLPATELAVSAQAKALGALAIINNIPRVTDRSGNPAARK